MNRLLLSLAALVAALVLSGVIFGAFFQHDTRTQARAFVVVAPAGVVGATGVDAMTQTVTALAATDVFRAMFINDLTVSGTVFAEEDLAQTVVQRETPELISVSVTTDNVQAERIATSGAYSVVRTMQAYYDTVSFYTFTVIDGAVVPQQAHFAQPLGIILSILIGTLLTAIIFSLVFSVHAGTRRSNTYTHGHIHASHARLDLKRPAAASYMQTEAQADARTEDYDYMRDMYRDYDLSLENLTQQSAETEETPEEHQEDDVEEVVEKTSVATQDIQQRIVAHKDHLKEKAREARDVVGAFFQRDKGGEVVRDDVAPSPVDTGAPVETAAPPANLPIAQSTPAHISTHSAPANLPVMPAPETVSKDVQTDDNQDAPLAEPTPAEVRRRLNELLSGKPPKISS